MIGSPDFNILAKLLDFSKAFEKVLLLHLSAKLGIRGSTLGWIRSVVDNWTRAVSVNGTHSSGGYPVKVVILSLRARFTLTGREDAKQSTFVLCMDRVASTDSIHRPYMYKCLISMPIRSLLSTVK